MKKNLPYFLVIAALIFLIIGVLSSGRQRPDLIAPGDNLFQGREVSEEVDQAYSFVSDKASVEAAQGEPEKDVSSTKVFNVYTDSSAPDNHFAPSGWMGDFADVEMDNEYLKDAHSGSTSIQVVYSAQQSQGAGWTGIYWQNPPNNWGESKGGFDLTGYNKLTFWARGENGGEVIEKFKVGGIKGVYSDSLEAVLGPVVLTSEWKKYTINLVGQDLSYVNGGFCWVSSSRLNPNGATFYLDDIRYGYEPGLAGNNSSGEQMPFDVYTEINSPDNHFIASGWMGDYGDLKIDESWTADPHAGTTCIRLVYSAKVSQGARWVGIYWQNPANNWGHVKDGGFDLSAAGKLNFWARGEKGGERIEEFKIGGISGDYPDSDTAGMGPVVLTPEWKEYSIDLSGKDLSHLIGGFCFSANLDVNPEGSIFYLDDIRYE